MRVLSVEIGDDGALGIQYIKDDENRPTYQITRHLYLTKDGVQEREHVKYWAAELYQAAEELIEWWDKYDRGAIS